MRKKKKTFIRDFKANESSMVPCGLPRNDELYNFDDNKVKSLKKCYEFDQKIKK